MEQRTRIWICQVFWTMSQDSSCLKPRSIIIDRSFHDISRSEPIIINNLAYPQQGPTTISSPVCSPPSSTTSLLLYPAEQASDKESDFYNILFTELPAPKAKIDNIKKIKSKGLAIILATSEESKKLIEEISNNASLKTKVSIKFPKKRHPSVIVYNVNNQIEESEIHEALRKCIQLEEDLTLRFKFKGTSPDNQNWVFKAPAAEFSKLAKINKIPFRWKIHRIGEFFHYKKCNFCQSNGHATKDCLNTIPSCGHCAGQHMSRDCNSEYIYCVNCIRNNQNFGTASAYPTWHHTKHDSCPCLQSVIDNYINSRDYF
ncbi:hypothetical protein AVEN_166227-1 [Araneus ventricosus]|uniref:CCHC-type domain-containing protein n=1 Tax=Araneus ventricosus TaxID=182803 RepID=A0A4Y2FQR1_ARAVE|nr:hypothetical protein AVEN_166227-1 [Araneus ventricosus]